MARFREIADDLLRRIDAGDFPPGTTLPTEKELQSVYEASRNTVRDAMVLLLRNGAIVSQPGVGAIAVQRLEPRDVLLGREGRPAGTKESIQGFMPPVSDGQIQFGPVRVEVMKGIHPVTEGLGVDVQESLVLRSHDGYIDGLPFVTLSSYYPLALAVTTSEVDRLLKTESGSPEETTHLTAMGVFEQRGYRDVITARKMDPREVDFFRTASSAGTVLEVSRTAYSADGTPYRLTVATYPSNLVRLRVGSGWTVPSRSQ